MQRLPVDLLLPELVTRLRERSSVVLEAPPGAGKTTRVPRALLDAGFARTGEIIVLQPRRLAARMSARRVAEELGEPVGETIGCQVRFEELAGPRTRVRFVTEGILTRRCLTDPDLRDCSVIVLDEFHERHLHSDVALAHVRRLQRERRPDLKLVVMSATLEAEPLVRYLDDAPRLRSEGRIFEVAVDYLPRPDERPLAQQVLSAVQRLVAEGLEGDVLVFLPGAAEIRRATEALGALASRAGLLVLPLHGDLSPAEQDRAVRKGDRRKVILSTNVAETSVTIDGIVAVVDSGLARIASHAPWSGLPVLRVGRISRASATQRAGRAGRTQPGRCVRLYTRHDHDTRPAHDAPEIRRLDLAETCLELRALGVRDVRTFPWFEAPTNESVTAADTLLERLGAVDVTGEITETGRSMLRFAVHPRQARMIVEGEKRGVAEEACLLAALVGERDVRATGKSMYGRPRAGSERAQSDLVELLEAMEQAEWDRFSVHTLRELGLEPGAVAMVDRVRKQLARRCVRSSVKAPASPEERETELLRVILAGYPDRVARRRETPSGSTRRGVELVLATGGTAVLAESSAVRDAELVVALDAEERADGRSRQVRVHMASAIESDWLIEMFTERVVDDTNVRWDAQRERVEAARRMTYDGLVLEETVTRTGIPADAVARVLVDAAVSRGLHTFVDGDALGRWCARVNFARRHAPELEYPDLGADALREALYACAEGCWSFDELRKAGLLDALKARSSDRQRAQLEVLAPDRITLPGGRRTAVEYPADGAPFVESRLQDFFGLAQGPRVAGGRVALVLHLLAPNHRAVQVTTDLAGFWERHYPTIARELRRKYPRHSWPDDPRNAAPPVPRGR